MNVLEQFNNLFPHLKDDVDVWFQNGKNSIRVRFRNVALPELVFTFDSKKNWTLETVNNFYKKIERRK